MSFTPDQVTEWIKCAEDPIYFIENYVKIVTLDEGLKLMELYEFQKDIVRSLWKNRKTVGVCARQMGKCFVKTTELNISVTINGETVHYDNVPVEILRRYAVDRREGVDADYMRQYERV